MYFASHPGAIAMMLALTLSILTPAFAEMANVGEQAPAAPTAPAAAEGEQGIQHRAEYKNTIDPVQVAWLINAMKQYQVAVDATNSMPEEHAKLANEQFKNHLRRQMREWTTGIKEAKIPAQNVDGMTITLDNLALVMKPLKFQVYKIIVLEEAQRQKIIEQGTREKPVGTVQEIVNQFTNDSFKSKARKTLSGQRDEELANIQLAANPTTP